MRLPYHSYLSYLLNINVPTRFDATNIYIYISILDSVKSQLGRDCCDMEFMSRPLSHQMKNIRDVSHSRVCLPSILSAPCLPLARTRDPIAMPFHLFSLSTITKIILTLHMSVPEAPCVTPGCPCVRFDVVLGARSRMGGINAVIGGTIYLLSSLEM
jgi:hypothetical protein